MGKLLTNYCLQLFLCPNVAKIVKWKGGIWYWNGIEHNYGTLLHKKRLAPLKKKCVDALIKANPTATAVVLWSRNIVTRESLLDISDCFITENAQIEVQKACGPEEPSLDVLVAKFCAFQQEYSGYVIASHLMNGVAVISCQTQWMAECLVHANQSARGFASLVLDAAHGWFAVSTSLLITSLIFCLTMQCWVPGIYSHKNGATAIHYKYHYLAMMQSARTIKSQLGGKIVDADFAGTVDFSKAQRLGFVETFVCFWKEDPSDDHTDEALIC
uniref:Uncharacterized protein n=1 Tax=Moniliophthora roreri TaxID=221103 RepID=A0A0W0GEG3_MONRR